MTDGFATVPVGVSVTVWVVAASLVFYVPFVVYRGTRRLDYPPARARRLTWKVFAVMALWAGAAVVVAATGAVRDEAGSPPWVLYWFFGVIILGTVGVARWSELFHVLAHRHTLAELLLCETARWLGSMFLILEATRQLPGFFAYPAAFGDILVGLTAIFAVIALVFSRSNVVPVGWTLLGLLDFVGAAGTAFLACQAIGLVQTDPPTSLLSQLPMSLFPMFMVSCSIVIHLTTLRLLFGPLRNLPVANRYSASASMSGGPK